MSVTRRLAAILAADVAGYSRLMAADESGTLAQLKVLRAEVIEPAIVRHHGRIVGSAGDSLLVEFASALGAVQCAAEMQAALAEKNADLPVDRRMTFRMGVNLGDVIAEDGTIHGDGVNIAARLEKLAEPGGLCIGRNVHDQVKGKLGYGHADLGEQRFHNIPEPVRAYRVNLTSPTAGSAPETSPKDAPPLPDKPSIAVLPFENMSGDPEQEYFSDGMVEEIITALSRMKWLFVIARNSSFTYKGRAVDVKQVGRELGVRYLLEGSVRKAGNRVRIAGQLIDAATGAHLWADRFDGALEDVFDMQDRVTASVVGAIAPKLEQAEIERSKRKPTGNLDAYDYYLRGLAGLHRWSREGTDDALSHFGRAVEIDSQFAVAHAMAASCYNWRKANGWVVDRAQDAVEAGQLARRAIELGKNDPIVLCWGGIALAYVVHEIEEGAAYVDQALTLDPNYAAAWGMSGWAYIWLGQPETAIERVARAIRLSPLDPLAYNWHSATAFAHFLMGRYDEACSWAERAMREAPTYTSAYRTLAISNAMAGRMDAAHRAVERLRQIDPSVRIADAPYLWPFRRPQDLDKIIEGLRKAGVPE